MRIFLRIVLPLLVILFLGSFALLKWRNKADIGSYPASFLAAVKSAKSFRVYEGFAREGIPDAKRLEEIAKQKKIGKQIREFDFYVEPVKLSEADAKQLLQLLNKPSTYLDTPYRPDCGGFHPDFAIEWEVDGQLYHLLLCFGCGEVQCFEGNHGFDGKMLTSEQQLIDLLTPYFKRRTESQLPFTFKGPKPTFHPIEPAEEH